MAEYALGAAGKTVGKRNSIAWLQTVCLCKSADGNRFYSICVLDRNQTCLTVVNRAVCCRFGTVNGVMDYGMRCRAKKDLHEVWTARKYPLPEKQMG